MKNFWRHTEETGRSMVEMLGVLAVVGVLSVGGIAGYSKAMAKFKVSKEQDAIQGMIANIRSLFASEPDYAGMDLALLTSTSILPKDMRGSTASEAVNSFGGQFYVESVSNRKEFSLASDAYPYNACIEIATADWGANSASGLNSMTVNGASKVVYTWGSGTATAVTDPKAGAATSSISGTVDLPISFGAVSSICGDSADNAIGWVFN